MSNTEILEGNKLIAEFMGATPCKIIVKTIGEVDGYESEEYKLPIDEIEYHESWDWLFPVVEKIESLGYKAVMESGQFKMFDVGGNFVLDARNDKTFLKNTYKGVVSFIGKWNEYRNESKS